MRITIDTKADSKEEIKKAVQLLLALSKEEIRENAGLFSVDKKEEAANAFVNIFGDNNARESNTTKKEPDMGTPIDFSSFNNLINSSEKTIKKDEPKLIFF